MSIPAFGRRPARRGPRTVLTALATALLASALVALGPAGAVLADPTPPSEQDVHDAQRDVLSAEASVAEMEVRLAQLTADAGAAEVAVQQAGEAYTRALDDADTARATADASAARALDASTDAEQARRELMAVARQMARSGGSSETIEALLSADGFEEVAQRSVQLERFTGKADDAVQRFRAARMVADTLQRRADDAAQAADDAETAAQDALDAAQTVQAGTQADLDAAAAERETLIVRLAAARDTSTQVEQERQDALDAANRARQNAAAQATHVSPSPGGTTAGGTTTGGTTGGTTTGGTTTGGTTTGGTTTGGTTTGGTTGGTTSPPPATTPPAATPPPATTPTPAPTPTAYGLGTGTSRGSAASGAAAVAWASAQVGKMYVYGAAGPDTFDCSGLTMMAWRNAGVNINRTSRDQYKGVLKISYDDLRPGDLVFWSTDPNDPNDVYHVAMWIGGGQIVEASRPGVPLRFTAMRWGSTMPYAGRP